VSHLCRADKNEHGRDRGCPGAGHGWRGDDGGRRVHTVRHGQGSPEGTAQLETAGVGITGLTTYDQDGTPEHGHQHNRRDFEPHAINAVVVRKWNGKDDGPVGKSVFLTSASVQEPLKPFDDDDRRLIKNCGIKGAKQQ
jgi:hypothetical protein